MSGKKIRACHLQVNDIYVKQGTEYIVTRIHDGKILYCLSSHNSNRSGGVDYIGANSQEWVILVGKKVSRFLTARGFGVRVTRLDGSLIGEYANIKAATKHLKLPQNAISRWLKNKVTNTNKHGYKYEIIKNHSRPNPKTYYS